MLEVKIIKCLFDNYSYLIKDKKTNLVAVVDPSEFSSVDTKIAKTYKKNIIQKLSVHHLMVKIFLIQILKKVMEISSH